MQSSYTTGAMSRRHFIDGDHTENVVQDALESLRLLHPGLIVDRENKTVYDASHNHDQCVSVISGGGAGHEPAHVMFVGSGMLAAAVSGNIFASPNVQQVFKCGQAVQGSAGTILIIKNYTGDVFHFHQAAEKLRSRLGMRIEVVVVADDVAVGRKKGGKVGRRGLAGSVLMHKILGAMSAAQQPLQRCLDMARAVNEGLATMAVSLDYVRIPGTACDAAEPAILRNDIELGMGIHNEPGVERITGPQPDIITIVDRMLAYLLDTEDTDRAFVNFDGAEHVVLMINNLGALSVLELSAITFHVSKRLGIRGITPARTYSGTYMSSLNGPGFSITLLRATPEMLIYLDAPTSALGWLPACASAMAVEPEITRFDTIVGDGDCGITLRRGCQAVQKALGIPASGGDQSTAFQWLLRIAHAVEESMDGTSGAIYGLFFDGLASSVRAMQGTETMTVEQWTTAAQDALKAVQRVTPARSGDRTLMDALEPFVEALSAGSGGLEAAVKAAVRGAEKTKGMRPAFGRAVYVNEVGWEVVPDPGAMGVVALVQGLAKGVAAVHAQRSLL
ncbi:Dak1-domain-containing protein [Aspergillus japonicus CBS 114.51]|uniref:Dak1-domain-containing protein n=1 Tax=Aspergillus japonicus CBS 114.51 TaxID=1448312 RepID=A0A8T8WN33_ASPJA|nr:Dak1-domain-containing protein [Aspergillus japonicus CBS 114.51]RAH77196.1 Dak1-domain-containing protein [Aspergillus japonicus CBS 114.51]